MWGVIRGRMSKERREMETKRYFSQFPAVLSVGTLSDSISRDRKSPKPYSQFAVHLDVW
jgi:hypothetical protein